MVSHSQVDFVNIARELAALSRRDVTQGIKLARYRKSASSMLKKDPVVGNTLLGVVACLEHDIQAMHAYHKKALDLSESSFSLMYYAVSLEKSCLWSDAARFALLALDHDPTNQKLLDATIELAPLTGRFSLLKRLLAQWQQLNDGQLHPREGDHDKASGILAWHGLSERDLKAALAAIGDALSETDLILRASQHLFVEDKYHAPFIHYRFVIPDNSVASYYEDLIAAKLDGAELHPRILEAFSFSIENSTVYDLYSYMEKELVESADTIRVPDPEKMKLIEELIAGVET